MSKNIQELIITDIEQFWINTINPSHQDSLLKNSGYKTGKQAMKLAKSSNYLLFNIVSSFFNHYLILKDEYIITFSETLLMSNKRIFINQNQVLSIPLNKITFYGMENNQVVMRYVNIGVPKTYYFINECIQTSIANNIIESHKNSPDLNNTDVQDIVSLPKKEFDTNELPAIAKMGYIKPKKKFDGGVIALILFVLCFGGCFYMMHDKDNRPTDYEALDRHEELKNRVTCSWCGGAGRVGYSGGSQAQTERTGMGTGNICTRCKGSGYTSK